MTCWRPVQTRVPPPMSVQSVLLPVFVQVALAFVLMFAVGRDRLAAVRRGKAAIDKVALGEPNWPAHALKAADAFNNL